MNKNICTLFAITLSATVSSCAVYKEPQQGSAAVLKNTVDQRAWNNFIWLLPSKVDGEVIAMHSGPLKLVPGTHRIQIAIKFMDSELGGGQHEAIGELSAKFETTKEYKIRGTIAGSGSLLSSDYLVTIWIEEENSKKIVSQKTTVRASKYQAPIVILPIR